MLSMDEVRRRNGANAEILGAFPLCVGIQLGEAHMGLDLDAQRLEHQNEALARLAARLRLSGRSRYGSRKPARPASFRRKTSHGGRRHRADGFRADPAAGEGFTCGFTSERYIASSERSLDATCGPWQIFNSPAYAFLHVWRGAVQFQAWNTSLPVGRLARELGSAGVNAVWLSCLSPVRRSATVVVARPLGPGPWHTPPSRGKGSTFKTGVQTRDESVGLSEGLLVNLAKIRQGHGFYKSDLLGAIDGAFSLLHELYQLALAGHICAGA